MQKPLQATPATPPQRASRGASAPSRLSNSLPSTLSGDEPIRKLSTRIDSGLDVCESEHVPGSDTSSRISGSLGANGPIILPPLCSAQPWPVPVYQGLPTEDIVLRPYGDQDPRPETLPYPAICPFADCTNKVCLAKSARNQLPARFIRGNPQSHTSAASIVKCPLPNCENEWCVADRAVSGGPSKRFGTSVTLYGTPEGYTRSHDIGQWEPHREAREWDGKVARDMSVYALRRGAA